MKIGFMDIPQCVVDFGSVTYTKVNAISESIKAIVSRAMEALHNAFTSVMAWEVRKTESVLPTEEKRITDVFKPKDYTREEFAEYLEKGGARQDKLNQQLISEIKNYIESINKDYSSRTIGLKEAAEKFNLIHENELAGKIVLEFGDEFVCNLLNAEIDMMYSLRGALKELDGVSLEGSEIREICKKNFYVENVITEYREYREKHAESQNDILEKVFDELVHKANEIFLKDPGTSEVYVAAEYLAKTLEKIKRYDSEKTSDNLALAHRQIQNFFDYAAENNDSYKNFVEKYAFFENAVRELLDREDLITVVDEEPIDDNFFPESPTKTIERQKEEPKIFLKRTPTKPGRYGTGSPAESSKVFVGQALTPVVSPNHVLYSCSPQRVPGVRRGATTRNVKRNLSPALDAAANSEPGGL